MHRPIGGYNGPLVLADNSDNGVDSGADRSVAADIPMHYVCIVTAKISIAVSARGQNYRLECYGVGVYG